MVAGLAENRERRALRAILIVLGTVVGLLAVTLLAVHSWDPHALVGGSADSVPFERIDPQHHLRPDPGLWVIQDGANWSAFWYGYLASTDRQPAPPTIDFTRYTVIVISQGMRPSTGYSLTVSAVQRNGAGLLVEAQETDPGAGCFVAPVLTSLYDIVKVPKTTAPVSVLLHWSIYSCPP